MTVQTTSRKATFLGNDVTETFPFSFKVFSDADLTVLLINSTGVETTLTLDSDYSVLVNDEQDSNPGGTVSYPLSGDPLVPGPLSGDPLEMLIVLGDALEESQPTNLVNAGGFFTQTVEDRLDALVVMIQQHSGQLARAMLVSIADDVALDLGTAANRAGKVLAFGANGDIAFDELLQGPDVITSGSFTATLTGMTETTQGTVDYIKLGSLVQLRIQISIIGTSNANTMSMTGLPLDVQPSVANRVYSSLLDNSVNAIPGEALIQAGTIGFRVGNPFSAAGFTASGSKGLEFGWTISYFMD